LEFDRFSPFLNQHYLNLKPQTFVITPIGFYSPSQLAVLQLISNLWTALKFQKYFDSYPQEKKSWAAQINQHGGCFKIGFTDALQLEYC